MKLTLSELEQAINYWRNLHPSTGEESALSPQVNALATTYALMIFNRQNSTLVAELTPKVQALINTWRAQRPCA